MKEFEEAESLNTAVPRNQADPSTSNNANPTPPINNDDVELYVQRITELEEELSNQQEIAHEIELAEKARTERAEREAEILQKEASGARTSKATLATSLERARRRVEELERNQRDHDIAIEREKETISAQFEERLALRDAANADLKRQLENAKREASLGKSTGHLSPANATPRVLGTNRRRISGL